MKIRILKDIPGYKAGEVHKSWSAYEPEERHMKLLWHSSYQYRIDDLIKDGYAEEVIEGLPVGEKYYMSPVKNACFCPTKKLNKMAVDIVAPKIVKKPSERIHELVNNNGKPKVAAAFTLSEWVDAIMEYLDERYDKASY